PVEAGFESREATVDFGVRGSKTKDLNQVVAFLNAGVQGADRGIRAIKNHPVEVTIKNLISSTIPSMLLYLYNRNDPEYKEKARWEKDLFYLIKVPGSDTYVRIPKPYMYGQVFGSLTERFLEYLDTKDPEAFDQYAQSLVDSMIPTQGDPASGLLATAIKPIIENAANYSFFRQRKLLPEGVEQLEPSEQYGRYTSETAKLLGKTVSYSPTKIENLLQGYLGGSSRYATGAGDYLINSIKKAAGEQVPEKPKDISRYPLLYGVTSRTGTMTGQAESVKKFYENRDKFVSVKETYDKLSKQGKNKEAKKLAQKNPNLKLAKNFVSTARKMSEINKRIDLIRLSTKLSAEDKKSKIMILERQKTALAKNTNKLAKGKK
ncbi:MAG: hypothetical protein PHH82_04615, partial [Candidatus ainarchaeum sp.]|nr:hypothetical protein [Candidatus ainarchaeum sp.]